MSVRLHFLFSMLATALIPQTGGAQEFPTETRREIGKFLDATARKEISVGHITVDSVAINGNTLQLFANMNCSYIPFREDNVAEIYKGISALLPTEFAKYRLQLRTNRHSIEELIPQALRSKKDKKALTFSQDVEKPLVTKVSRPYTPTNGLQNRHIALWQSHGFYYEPKLNRWEWQRARCLQTVEDLYTQSFVLPYLLRCWKTPEPMCCFRVNATARLPKSLSTMTVALTPTLPIPSIPLTRYGGKAQEKASHIFARNT